MYGKYGYSFFFNDIFTKSSLKPITSKNGEQAVKINIFALNGKLINSCRFAM